MIKVEGEMAKARAYDRFRINDNLVARKRQEMVHELDERVSRVRER